MWVLVLSESCPRHEDTVEELWLAATNRIFKAGRRDCDILLNDKTISRVHAEFYVKSQKSKDKKSVLLFKDLSKFGTFVNNKKVETRDFFALEEDSVVKFSKDFEYHVHWIPTTFCCSGLKKKEAEHVKELVERIDGDYVDDWSQCTHLIMREIILTMKFLLCLINQKFVVDIKWLETLESQTSCNPIPCSGFLPVCNLDITGFSLDPSPKRATLFKNKKFIFLDQEQCDKASEFIIAARGTVDVKTVDDLIPYLCKQSIQTLRTIVVIHGDDEGVEEQALLKQLDEIGIVRVPEADVGLALIKCDTSEYFPEPRDIKLPAKSKVPEPSGRLSTSRAAATKKTTPTSTPTPKQETQSQQQTSPGASSSSKIRYLMKPEHPAPTPRPPSPPKLPARPELQILKRAAPPSEPDVGGMKMVVIDAPLVVRKPTTIAKKFKKYQQTAADDHLITLMEEHDDTGNEAKQRWLAEAEKEAKEEEKIQKEGNSLFNAALARSKRSR